MTQLSIDAASEVAGYAVLRGLGRDDLIDAGRFKGSEAVTPYNALAEPLRGHMRDPAMACTRRLLDMRRDLIAKIEEHRPDRVVVEIPSGKAGAGSRRGARSSLAVYGYGAGWLAGVAQAAGYGVTGGISGELVLVNERQWTGRGTGVGIRKPDRPAAVYALYPDRYDPAADPGADTADAVLLGRWWIERTMREGAA